uniref:Secreted protein n=1 Tax=Rhizophora mucronata TaxID=61149 RepID=A0A2P2QYP7_RHIMU
MQSFDVVFFFFSWFLSFVCQISGCDPLVLSSSSVFFFCLSGFLRGLVSFHFLFPPYFTLKYRSPQGNYWMSCLILIKTSEEILIISTNGALLKCLRIPKQVLFLCLSYP